MSDGDFLDPWAGKERVTAWCCMCMILYGKLELSSVDLNIRLLQHHLEPLISRTDTLRFKSEAPSAMTDTLYCIVDNV